MYDMHKSSTGWVIAFGVRNGWHGDEHMVSCRNATIVIAKEERSAHTSGRHGPRESKPTEAAAPDR